MGYFRIVTLFSNWGSSSSIQEEIMIICNCNNISHAAVREAALKANNFKTMLDLLKYKYECGACFDILKEIWNELN